MGRAALIPPELTTGPFNLEDARHHGLTDEQLRGSTWRRLGNGVYAWCEIADSPMVRLAAASMRFPSSAVFSGRTAAWIHGLEMAPCDPIEVTVPSQSQITRRTGIAVRRRQLSPSEIAHRHGLRVTSPLCTVADLACCLKLVESVVVLDAAMHRGLLTPADVEAWAADHAGARGVRSLRRALALAEPATESPMETRLRLLLVLAGLPRPRVQVTLYDADGDFIARPDLYYTHARLAIEYDGAAHRANLAADNRRLNRFTRAGYRVLRFTAADVYQMPLALVADVRRALQDQLSTSLPERVAVRS